MFTYLTNCLGVRRKAHHKFTTSARAEKSGLYSDEPKITTRAEAVDAALDLLLSATGPHRHTAAALEQDLRANGWWDEVTAKALLAGLEEVLRAGADLSGTLQHACDTALAEAKHIAALARDFATEHPLLTGVVCAVVALGVLYLFWPAALELLGFGAKGPVAGRWRTLTLPYITSCAVAILLTFFFLECNR